MKATLCVIRSFATFQISALRWLVFFGCAFVSTAAEVTVCNEAGLRNAIASGGAVLFGCDGVITLSNTITISADTELDGNGRAVTISGNNAVRVFYVNPGVSFTLRNLTVADGSVIGISNMVMGGRGETVGGAGIFNNGILTLVNCTLSNHVARGGVGGGGGFVQGTNIAGGQGGNGRGAAIHNAGGTVRCSNSVFTANSAIGGAGPNGISTANGGHGLGGAFFSDGGAFVFSRATFVMNRSVGGDPGRDGASQISNWGLGGSAIGGAVYSFGATGAVVEAHFMTNTSRGAGLPWNGIGTGAGIGGAVCVSNGVVTVIRGIFSNNIASSGLNFRFGGTTPANGGAIANSGTMEVIECHFAGNLAVGGDGGGPAASGYGGGIDNSGVLSVLGCTLDRNTAAGGTSGNAGNRGWPPGDGCGGGLHNVGTLSITNSTLLRNFAGGGYRSGFTPGSSGGAGRGGAIATFGSVNATHLTVVSNWVFNGPAFSSTSATPGSGGGVYATNGGCSLYSTLLAYNLEGSNGFGILLDGGANISSDGSCNFTAPGSLNSTDPLLGPFDDFGGRTLTMPLLENSPAIDAAPVVGCPPTDQRGHARPYGAGCDIGAFESSPPYSIRGSITGYRPAEGIVVSTVGTTTTNKPNGNYRLVGVAFGPNTLVPSGSNAFCIPSSRSVDVIADMFGIDFKAYLTNGLTVDGYSNNTMTLVYAGVPGQVHETHRSPDLTSWSSISTNTVGTNGIFSLQASNGPGSRLEFFRTRQVQ
jgi:hypothetical protein